MLYAADDKLFIMELPDLSALLLGHERACKADCLNVHRKYPHLNKASGSFAMTGFHQFLQKLITCLLQRNIHNHPFWTSTTTYKISRNRSIDLNRLWNRLCGIVPSVIHIILMWVYKHALMTMCLSTSLHIVKIAEWLPWHLQPLFRKVSLLRKGNCQSYCSSLIPYVWAYKCSILCTPQSKNYHIWKAFNKLCHP